MNNVTLKNIFYDYGGPDSELIHNWDFIDLNFSLRLFYKRSNPVSGINDKTGFKFCIVFSAGQTNNIWSLDCFCEVLYHGEASWDGIKHLYLGSKQTKNYGYDYYPYLQLHQKSLSALRMLEMKFCYEYSEIKK